MGLPSSPPLKIREATTGKQAVVTQMVVPDGAIVDNSVSLSFIPSANTRIRHYLATGVNLNSANTDVRTWANLPAKYILRQLLVFDASTSLTTATIDLRSASGGGGIALISAFSLSALTTPVKYAICTLAGAVGTDYWTVTTLYLRNVTAQGSPATASFLLEIEDLT